MKITMKSFFMAALALMTVACSNDDNNFAQQPKTGEGITITAQLAPKSGNDATRSLVDKSTYIESKWAVDEHIAILYEVSGTKYAADARIIAVDGSTGAATIEFTVNGSTANNTPCTLIYPYLAANGEHDGLKDVGELLGAQNGTLNANLDVRMGAGTIYTVTPRLSVTTQPAAQYAIFKFTTKNAAGSATINVKPLTITTGAQNFVITPSEASSTFYAALPPLTGEAISFIATSINGHTNIAAYPSITFTAGKYYQSTIKMTEYNTIDLSSVTENTTAQNGDVLTGTLGANVKISIADGATVTLNGVTINGTDNSSYSWAGLTCEGDATIILADGTTNIVKGFYSGYSGIYVPEGKTLIIKGQAVGNGTLEASSNGSGAGIGGSWYLGPCGNIEIQGGIITATGSGFSAGIGSFDIYSCGTITISGGTVTAEGGKFAAGIGSSIGDGNYISSCGAISITGGTVTATGGDYAAGIGSGKGGRCSNITIANTVTHVIAYKGEDAYYCIGAGNDGTCGTVKLGSMVMWYEGVYQQGDDYNNQDFVEYYGN